MKALILIENSIINSIYLKEKVYFYFELGFLRLIIEFLLKIKLREFITNNEVYGVLRIKAESFNCT